MEIDNHFIKDNISEYEDEHPEKFPSSHVICSGYLFKFNVANSDGRVFTKDGFDFSQLDNLKLNGLIRDFENDDIGIIIIKAVEI